MPGAGRLKPVLAYSGARRGASAPNRAPSVSLTTHGVRVTFASATNGGTLDATTGEVVWMIGSLPPGPGQPLGFTVDVASPLPNGTALSSVAEVTDPIAQPASAQATVYVSSGSVLTFNKTSSRPTATFGQQVSYSLNAQNLGNATALNVVITDTLPPVKA